MKTIIVESLHPLVSLVRKIIASTIIISLLFYIELHSKELDITAYVAGAVCILAMLYGAYFQRKVEFDGKIFTLRDILGRNEYIDITLFEAIEGVTIFTYKISFSNGKSYLFLINPINLIAESMFLDNFGTYHVALTNQVVECVVRMGIERKIGRESSNSFILIASYIKTILISMPVVYSFIYLTIMSISTYEALSTKNPVLEEFSGVVRNKYKDQHWHDTPIIEIEQKNEEIHVIQMYMFNNEVFTKVQVGDTISTFNGDSVIYIRRSDSNFSMRKIPQ